MLVGNATLIPCNPDSKINTVDTINLSATGSRNAPNDEVTFHLRARYPSSQSVNDAIAKRIEQSMLDLVCRCDRSFEVGWMGKFGR